MFIKELNQKWFTKVLFPEKEIDLALSLDQRQHRSYVVWSIELGLVWLDLKANQTLLNGIVKKLNKLQREDSPSHLIVREETAKENGDVIEKTTTWTVYRLTDEQEAVIFNDYLLPSMNKRDDRREKRMIEEQEKFENDWARFIAEQYEEN